MGTLIKICGITCESDIDILNKFIPEYAGFIFAESKRRVDARRAARLAKNLDLRIKKAGVFVNEEAYDVIGVVMNAGLDVVQLHGNETPDYIGRLRRLFGKAGLSIEIWKAFRVSETIMPSGLHEFDVDRFLFDTYIKDMAGGTGECFDWGILSRDEFAGVSRVKLVLAGGLNPFNVNSAIVTVQPAVVDVSSGVEVNGAKDYELVCRFVETVRRD